MGLASKSYFLLAADGDIYKFRDKIYNYFYYLRFATAFVRKYFENLSNSTSTKFYRKHSINIYLYYTNIKFKFICTILQIK